MLGSILGILLSGSVKSTVARTKRNGVFVAVAAVLVLTAYIFALVALALWLATIYGLIVGSLIIAGGALLIGVAVFIVMASMNAEDARRAREKRLAAESLATVGLGLLRAQPMLAAAVAGAFLLSNIMGSRSSDD
jgi:small neutral amino acid transporter SnatA (MarC family)